MARRTRAQSTPPELASPAPRPEVRLGVSTELGEETFTYYANFAEVACLPHEFAILFARMPAKLPADKITEAMSEGLHLACDVQILIPTTLVDGLIRALTGQKAIYEEKYGAIHNPGGIDAEDSAE
jgi:hypothetical protein